MLEVTGVGTLGLLRAEKGDCRLGGDSCGTDRLGCGNDGETVTLGLPGKVDDGVLDGVDNLDRDTLLLDAEDLEGRGLRLLGLGVTVDLDAEVGALGLPVELSITDTEEVQATDNLLGGDAHEADLGGVAANFGCPEAEELLVRLDSIALDRGGRPVKVHHAVNLDGGLVEQVHAGELIDGNGIAGVQTSAVLVVGRPLESRPLLLGGRLALLGLGRIQVGKRT